MPLLVYSVLRVAILAGCVVVLYLLDVRGWLLAVVAVVLAALVSYLALPRQRAAAAAQLARRARRTGRPRFSEAIDADARAEDADGGTPAGGSQGQRDAEK